MRIQGKHYKTVWFEDGALHLINQPLLPHRFETVSYTDYREVATAITTMVVRGAPAIGATGAFGMALAAGQGADLTEAAQVLGNTRPTAQDLFYGIQTVQRAASAAPSDPATAALAAAHDVADRYETACETIGELGAELIAEGARISTHCNAGWLATVDWGTATAPMYKAHRQGRSFFVFVDETRPRCQGSRLTAFELGEEGIPHAVIADNATGHFMARGEIDMVIVGSDRIARNGDIANKIGTYSSAVVARENGIPFYVAAPVATIDPDCPSGDAIPIEERSGDEVACMFGWDNKHDREATIQIAPKSSPVRNPAFDVTPARFVTGIITEKGIFAPENLAQIL
jgi:methylthioribose-1-phosphate isomerase